jgi:3-oxoacyl-[acyl-carrier protein] reductase
MVEGRVSGTAAIDLRGKRALVTGGSRGIGAATARLLARAGADVLITYRSRSQDAERVVREMRALGVRAWAEAGDHADPKAVERIFERCRAEMGGLDAFIANAGIWTVEPIAFGEMSDAQWREMIETNLSSVFYTTRAALRLMADHGRIVLVSSTAGQRGEPFHAHYAATKGALLSLVKSLCIECAPRGITVNAVAPGWVVTEMTAEPLAGPDRAAILAEIPLRRVAEAEDIAGPIVFLCSPWARHITGEVLNVNGGSVLCG